MKLKVAVLGGGSWGCTVASLISSHSHATLWARKSSTVDEINTSHTNEKYLPGGQLRKKLIASSQLNEIVGESDLVVVGIPSHGFRQIIEQIKGDIRPWVPVVSLTKGLEPKTNFRMSQIIEEILPNHPVGVLSGPNLAREIIAGQAAATVLAMSQESALPQLQNVFQSAMFRVYTSTDVVGCELGGALKNVVAIAAGMGDGMSAGDNTKAGVITRGLAELTRLGVVMGGRPETFAGLAGMGDLIATCSSALSRNHAVGVELGKGRAIENIIDEMNMVAEGVKSCRVVVDLAEQYEIDMPIARAVYGVLHEGKTAKQALRTILRTDSGSEADPG
ncbi:MAG: NAD(P)H-dependent glycerol-3-phosphate dehydrogenase [Pseudomonadales bacterium]|nr:NAD(P)H-dependent glycerol-3-phosphate dehydrogenase [Pseudomonadales bacterium]